MTMPSPTINLELLIKLMKLTASNTDGEALAAVRMANKLLNGNGGDWENLLRGKLAPINPFKSIAEPKPQATARPTPQPSQPYTPPPRPQRPYSPPPPPPPSRHRGVSKQESKLVSGWLVKCEFSSKLDATITRQIDVISKQWDKTKALTDTEFNYLKTAALGA